MQDTKCLHENNDNESNNGDIFLPIRKNLKRSIIDKSKDKENMMRQSQIWQKVKNTPMI